MKIPVTSYQNIFLMQIILWIEQEVLIWRKILTSVFPNKVNFCFLHFHLESEITVFDPRTLLGVLTL